MSNTDHLGQVGTQYEFFYTLKHMDIQFNMDKTTGLDKIKHKIWNLFFFKSNKKLKSRFFWCVVTLRPNTRKKISEIWYNNIGRNFQKESNKINFKIGPTIKKLIFWHGQNLYPFNSKVIQDKHPVKIYKSEFQREQIDIWIIKIRSTMSYSYQSNDKTQFPL